MTTRAQTYRPDIDGLRAIAVVGVVAYHVGIPGFAGGYRGVDVFFVISGYLITGMLWQEIDTTGRLSLLTFYARRARRILPAMIVVILATLMLGSLVLSPLGEMQGLAKSAIAALLLVANNYFLAATHQYFDPPSELVPLLHLWSLSIEEQFYLVWPLAILVVAKFSSSGRGPAWARAIIVTAIATSFVFHAWLMSFDRSAAFYLAAARAWQLLAGALLAVSVPNFGRRRSAGGTGAAATGLALVLVSLCFPNVVAPFPGIVMALPVVGTVLMVCGNGLAPTNVVSRLLSTRPLVAVGILSYGWYLWHWPLLALARSMRVAERDLLLDAVWACLALGLAALTLRYVENPVRRGTVWTKRSNGFTFACGGSAIATLIVLAAAIDVLAQREWTSDTARLALSISTDLPPHQTACRLDPLLWTGVLPMERCTIGAGAGLPRVVLWGDSHADAWSPTIEVATRWQRARFAQLTMHSCAPLVAAPGSARTDRVSKACAEFNAHVVDFLRSRPDGLGGVVISARWPAYVETSDRAANGRLVDFGAADHGARLSLAAFESRLSATLAVMREANLRVLIVLQPPHFARSLPKCIETKPPDACGLDRASYERQQAALSGAIRRGASGFGNARIVDPADYFCNVSACPAFVDNRPAVSDDNHVSASAARGYAHYIERELNWLLGANG